jgi:hypothetical protein
LPTKTGYTYLQTLDAFGGLHQCLGLEGKAMVEKKQFLFCWRIRGEEQACKEYRKEAHEKV